MRNLKLRRTIGIRNNATIGLIPWGMKSSPSMANIFHQIFYNHNSTRPAPSASSFPLITASLICSKSLVARPVSIIPDLTIEHSPIRKAYREATLSSCGLSARSCCHFCHDALSLQESAGCSAAMVGTAAARMRTRMICFKGRLPFTLV